MIETAYCAKTANHHVNASRTIKRQLTFWIDIICWWERQCKTPMNASFSWIMKVLVWRHISAGFLVPNPLWTHVAWEYQNTGLGACLNLSLAIHMPGEFNEARGGANEVSTRSDVLTCSTFCSRSFLFLCFFSVLSFSILSCSFLFFPVRSFSFRFFHCLSVCFTFFWTLTFQQMQFYDCSRASERNMERLSLQFPPSWLPNCHLHRNI